MTFDIINCLIFFSYIQKNYNRNYVLQNKLRYDEKNRMREKLIN